MQLFVGLGNPGPEHARHRHNVGFMAVDAIAAAHRFGPWRKKYQGLLAEGMLGPERVLLLKPLTFMNRSGQSVASAAGFYKLAPAEVVVLHDELDLAPGKVRIKSGGGVAGHNGLRSIAAQLGTRDFRRVRIGIGHPGHKDRVTPHVLGNFATTDIAWRDRLLEAVALAAPLIAAGDDARAMNRIALEMQPILAPEAAEPSKPTKPVAAG